MIESIGTGVTSVVTWCGNVISAIFGAQGSWADLLPAIGIAVGIGIVGFGIRILKSTIWGY